MTDMPAASAIEDRAGPVDAIADFVAGFSLEATRPSAEEVAALAPIAPSGTRVYVSAVPTRPAQEAIEAAAQLRKAGFEPVPHLAARGFASARALDDFLARISGESGVVCLLIIAGDHDEPAGDFRCALEVIDGGKDADIAIWNGHPFSVYSRVDTTFIDGEVFFDREQDLARRPELAKERAALEQAEPNRPRTQGPSPQTPRRRPSGHEDDDIEVEKP